MDPYFNDSLNVCQICDLMQCRCTENCRFSGAQSLPGRIRTRTWNPIIKGICVLKIESKIKHVSAQWCKLEPIPETSICVAYRHTSFSGQFFFRVVLHYHLEKPGLGERMILKWIFRKWDRGTWTGLILTENRDGWQALVIAAINFRVA